MGRHRKRKHRKGSGSILPAICLTLFIFSAAIVIILNSRWLYYLDIKLLNISEYSGMDEMDIRANYKALINWCMVWNRGELVLPTLPVSKTGRIHLEECKRIFDAVQLLFAVSGILSFLTVRNCLRRYDRRCLRVTGILCFMVPAVLAAAAYLDWNRFFLTFHQIFFRNDYWLFDPVTDPVILILPDGYFYHCALGILVIVAVSAVICLIASRNRRNERKYSRRK